MPMMNRGVEVPCKRCNKPAPATEMVLDPVYRMMVCRKCVEERRMKENPVRPGAMPSTRPGAATLRPVTVSVPKTPSQSAKPGSAPASSAARLVAAPSKTKIKCRKCGWAFNFDAEKNYPQNCPSCGAPSKSGYDFF